MFLSALLGCRFIDYYDYKYYDYKYYNNYNYNHTNNVFFITVDN